VDDQLVQPGALERELRPRCVPGPPRNGRSSSRHDPSLRPWGTAAPAHSGPPPGQSGEWPLRSRTSRHFRQVDTSVGDSFGATHGQVTPPASTSDTWARVTSSPFTQLSSFGPMAFTTSLVRCGYRQLRGCGNRTAEGAWRQVCPPHPMLAGPFGARPGTRGPPGATLGRGLGIRTCPVAPGGPCRGSLSPAASWLGVRGRRPAPAGRCRRGRAPRNLSAGVGRLPRRRGCSPRPPRTLSSARTSPGMARSASLGRPGSPPLRSSPPAGPPRRRRRGLPGVGSRRRTNSVMKARARSHPATGSMATNITSSPMCLMIRPPCSAASRKARFSNCPMKELSSRVAIRCDRA
jgi:hypothetical protein